MFEEFRNSIMHRTMSSQYKASRIYDKIQHKIPDDVKKDFMVEWNHFFINGITFDEFENLVKSLQKYFEG